MKIKTIKMLHGIFTGKFILCLFLLFTLTVQNSNAQEFTATVSSPSVAVGDQFQITFSLNANGQNFKAPAFADFNVLMGPNQSTQMQIINGTVSQTITFTYVLQAIKEGTFKIGSAEIYAGNTKYLSNPISVIVSKSAGKQQGGAAQGQSNPTGEAVAGGKNVFIKVKIDKSNVFQGEAVNVTYQLYTKVTLLNYSVNKLPSFNGFWSQEISLPQQLEFRNENLNGVGYKVADIKKVILFPQRTGSLSIDPMEGEVVARVQANRQQSRSNDPFDQFFNDPFFNNPFFNNNVRDIKITLKSDPLKVNVRPLPSGAPPGFTGAVGKFSCDISLDKKEVRAHDAINLKIKISGKGNIRLIEAPKIDFPPDFETYDPKENVTANATSAGVTGTKTFEFLLIPRTAGNYKLNIEPFSFYDIEKKQYHVIPAAKLVVKVGRGNETETTVISGVSPTDVQVLGKDIRFIKTRSPEFKNEIKPLFYSPLFFSLVLSPALLFAGLIFFKRNKETQEGNVKVLRSKRANKIAMKRLSAAKKYLSSNEKEKFLDEMFRALWGFISDKLQIPVSELSKESAALALQQRNVPDTIILQFTETIDKCEFARFAGGLADSNESIYNKGIDIISRLESILG